LPSRFLSKRLVLALQRDLIDSFGGAYRLRDEMALDSALAQPEATFGDELLHPGVVEQSAAYLFHLCMAHAFVDGNKRIAFAAMDTFLRLNGHRFVPSDERAYQLTVAVARGEMDKADVMEAIRAAVVPG
jgi:death-on-curing protein